MIHALVNTAGAIARVQDFGAAEPPTMAPEKGLRWMPYVDTERPPFDAMTHGLREAAPQITPVDCVRAWEVFPLPLEDVAANQAGLQANIVAAAQARLDAWAQTRGYDGILSAATYAASAVPQFAAEGQAAVNARDATWATLYTLLLEVQMGTRPMPTSFADVEPLLPALAWPA